MTETTEKPKELDTRERFIDQYGYVYDITGMIGQLRMGKNQDCDVCIPPKNSDDRINPRKGYETVSRAAHAIFDTSTKEIRDNNSTCGVKVNDRKVYSGFKKKIENGDRITLGELDLVYRCSADNQGFGEINEETIVAKRSDLRF